jgi:hypothetical protein
MKWQEHKRDARETLFLRKEKESGVLLRKRERTSPDKKRMFLQGAFIVENNSVTVFEKDIGFLSKH